MRFLLALQFLTIFPIKIKKNPQESDLASSMVFFPIVGLLLGFLLVAIDFSLSPFLSKKIVAIILVTFLFVITKGLHLDGLSDTFDALFSGKDKKQKLAIMKDSQIGAMGATALFLSLLLKIALIENIPPLIKVPALILFPAVSRCSMLFPAKIFKYAREEGTGKSFIENLKAKHLFFAFFITALIVFSLLQIKGLIAFFLTILSILVFTKIVSKSIGGISGDILGAVNEISEISFLLYLEIFGFLVGNKDFCSLFEFLVF